MRPVRLHYDPGIRRRRPPSAGQHGARFSVHLVGDGGYQPSAPADQPQTSRVLNARFELRRERNRLGRVSYTLAIN